jgi:hypothetical protein
MARKPRWPWAHWLWACRELAVIWRRHAGPRNDGLDRRVRRSRCVPINHATFRIPDPLLYAQSYLISLDLAVTWDNPDIEIRRDNKPVSSSDLEPDTDYEIVARIWNGSVDAPVIEMPVHFSFLSFGIGTLSNAIGSTKITIGVKGSANQPAVARMPWRTPALPGHYCIQVLLDPIDDINYHNNLGQENTQIRRAESPALFNFQLRNNTRRRQRYHFMADGYALGRPEPCGERDLDREERMARHRRATHLPAGWAVELTPRTPTLEPAQEVSVSVRVTTPSEWVGRQHVNINAYHEHSFAGGVTLTTIAGPGV